MKQLFKGESIKELVWRCARASTIPEFNRGMEELKSIDSKAYDWLRRMSHLALPVTNISISTSLLILLILQMTVIISKSFSILLIVQMKVIICV
jgi:hypothetical protein